MKKRFVVLGLLLLCLGGKAQDAYVPSPENLEARKEFQDSKFGIFLHWGLYSMLAQGEWVMTNQNLDHMEYRKLASAFYPSRFDAAEWVAAIKAAGAKYICFTTRHHEGFSMFDSRFTDYNIVKATPFGRDVLKELAEECHKQGIKLHLYYSHLDWDRDDYYPLGRTGRGTGRTTHGEWKTYYQFMNDQITELLTNYGPIGAIWFDGWWDKPDADWQLERQYTLIHRLQPGCLIGNNHHKAPFDGEDFQMFERDLPGQNKAGYSADAEISALPLESCETMNNTWGYNINDRNFKSTKQLIHTLVGAAGNNANLLLNVGPRPGGDFPEGSVTHLKEIGEWMRTYGETIQGTRAGTIPHQDWGVTTQKGNKLYVHILNLNKDQLLLPITNKKVKTIMHFKDKTPVKYTKTKEGILLQLGSVPTDIDHVVEITYR